MSFMSASKMFFILFVVSAYLWIPSFSGAGRAAAMEEPPFEVRYELDSPGLLGKADVDYLFFDLYQAELWTQAGEAFRWDVPFALTLVYQRSFTAVRLAETSVDEMARISQRSAAALSDLTAPLTDCFADVEPGDRITGVGLGPNEARFFLNGQKRCDISYPDFTKLFFSIWLGDGSRDAETATLLREGA